LGDVRDVFEPYLAIFLSADRHWNQAQVGVAIATTNIAGVLVQTLVGNAVDRVHFKRLLIAMSALAIGTGYGMILRFSMFPAIVAAQALVGIASATVTPAINAVSLGLVGQDKLAKRTGRNEAFNRTGNTMTAAIAGALGLWVGRPWIFVMLIVLCAVSLAIAFQIHGKDINYAAARAEDQDGDKEPNESWRDLLGDRNLRKFCVAVTLFYLANAALLPLVSQVLAGGKGNAPSMYVSACIIVAQLTMIPVTAWTGKAGNSWGRKPLMLLAFAALLLRASLYAFNQQPWFLVSMEVLDGIASGVFSVLSVVIVADITQGSGRFNLVQGIVQTTIGWGQQLVT
jgi:MFS family permease